MSLVKNSIDEESLQPVAARSVVSHVKDQPQTGIRVSHDQTSQSKKSSTTNRVSTAIYQFKITLMGLKSPIWRRIQVADCTFDKLHEHIQTAMGWTNSHLHQFKINGKIYGDPALLVELFDDSNCVDSTNTHISRILPDSGKLFSFIYDYDFGDRWSHEVLFEGCLQKRLGKSYPLCIEGKLACPPEDVGGIDGFHVFLKALANPKHRRHDEFVKWAGDFKPKAFDVQRATRKMKEGVPNWRLM